MSETEEEREDRESGSNDLAVETGLCGLEAGCCLLSLINMIALVVIPVSALLLLNR